MKNIFRKRNALLSVALSAIIVFAACKDDFLQVPAAGQLSDAQLVSKEGIEGLLISSYGMLLGRAVLPEFFAGSTNWVGGSVQGGESNKGTDAGDAAAVNAPQRYEQIPSSDLPNQKWKGAAEGIVRCNAVLRALLKAPADVSAADAIRMKGEARFLRGHYYFDMKKAFNNVPYIDENTTEPDKVKNDKDLWAFIEADFKFAYENLPETQSAAGRANKWAAGVYLAKALLFQKKYADALTIFNAVIANGKTTNGKKYGLAAKFNDCFNVETENNEEHVFASQGAVNTGTTYNAQPEFVLQMFC